MSNPDKNELEKLINDGITYKKIAKFYKISLSTIRRLCSKYGLKSKINELKRKKANCPNCNKEIKTTENENKKFCSHSCAAIFNNKKREKNIIMCLNCNIEIISPHKHQKYCSLKCRYLFEMKESVFNKRIIFLQ